MSTQTRRYMPGILALASLALASALLAHEHFNGGVRSHHLLDRADLPTVSNWFGLATLPLLGWLADVRLRNQMTPATRTGFPIGFVLGLVCSLLYGAALAASFAIGASTITTGLFLGLFLLAAALPVYRIEFILGFVVGMSFTFGSVLPTLVAGVVAVVSFLVRFAFTSLMSTLKRNVEV